MAAMLGDLSGRPVWIPVFWELSELRYFTEQVR